jgi:hypothetical protein
MNKKTYLILCLAILLSACIPTPSPTATPTSTATFTTVPSATPTPTPTLAPTATPISLATLEMGGILRTFTAAYDPELWDVDENDFGQILTLKADPDCQVMENIPRGVPDETEIRQFQAQYGHYTVDVAQYMTSDSEVFLEVIDFTEENVYIAIQTGADPADCLSAGRAVVEASAQIGFAP